MKKHIAYLPLLAILASSLSGCSTFDVASFASMAVTGKSFSDHALSVVMGQDCVFLNIVQGKEICVHDDSAEMMLLTSNQMIDDSSMVIAQLSPSEPNYSNRLTQNN